MDTITPTGLDPMSYIALHGSDIAAFKTCRRRWNWSSPIRMNLKPDVVHHGISFPLWFGTGVHYALEKKYSPNSVLRHVSLPILFNAWYDREIRKFNALDPDIVVENDDELREHCLLGLGMLQNYEEWMQENDDFHVLATEHAFAVPIGNLTAVDPRDGETKPVMFCGKMDAIVYDHNTETFGIIDHKTSSNPDDEFFEKLDKDEQVVGYMWAAEQEARLHDLPWKKISFVYYNTLRKNYPKPPTILERELKNGTIKRTLSTDRQKEATTPELWDQSVVELGLDEWAMEPSRVEYREWLENRPEDWFIRREYVTVNDHEIAAFGQRVYDVACDMTESPRVYPAPTGDWRCLRCAFRSPCLAADDGSDADYMLRERYIQNESYSGVNLRTALTIK